MNFLKKLPYLILIVLSTAISASELLTFQGSDGQSYLNWSSLVKKVEPIDNPFLTMSHTDLEMMKDYASLNRRVESNSSVFTEEDIRAYQSEMDSIAVELKASGLNPLELIEARNKIMEQQYHQITSPNPEVVDQTWKMLGFIAPIDFDGTKVTRFFLVPTAGACIHTPAPPPNQIIMVEFEQGIELKRLEDPIWVEGKLESEMVTGVASYYDGQSQVDAIYTMKADESQFYK
ncbi:DUF3299 domain-containing protein [Photobacterium rosenbergii]|uniref:DUF3299 domain-containing protein n=1 Tax=Photobacterium rosenbergii TaxID=294936 RepID=A0ABU3ZHR7_9GAMM|nr:DUF3299 domain-containing protein [Photobacterium rosenbergii]MDV5169636.1 DUF3299 domain-containing protein [Photobacterium rosenbergii]